MSFTEWIFLYSISVQLFVACELINLLIYYVFLQVDERCTKNELVALLTLIYAMCADFVKQYAKQSQ